MSPSSRYCTLASIGLPPLPVPHGDGANQSVVVSQPSDVDLDVPTADVLDAHNVSFTFVVGVFDVAIRQDHLHVSLSDVSVDQTILCVSLPTDPHPPPSARGASAAGLATWPSSS